MCSTSFEQFNQLRQHVATAHIDKNGPSRWYSKKTCDICSNVFATSKTLSKHIKAVHNRIKPFICNVCGYKSARKSTWEVIFILSVVVFVIMKISVLNTEMVWKEGNMETVFSKIYLKPRKFTKILLKNQR